MGTIKIKEEHKNTKQVFFFISPEVQELSVGWMIPMGKTVEKRKTIGNHLCLLLKRC